MQDHRFRKGGGGFEQWVYAPASFLIPDTPDRSWLKNPSMNLKNRLLNSGRPAVFHVAQHYPLGPTRWCVFEVFGQLYPGPVQKMATKTELIPGRVFDF